jgi:hypothetical protein
MAHSSVVADVSLPAPKISCGEERPVSAFAYSTRRAGKDQALGGAMSAHVIECWIQSFRQNIGACFSLMQRPLQLNLL